MASTSARAAAHDILRALDSGRGHSNQLLGALPDSMPERDRGLAAELVYGVQRRRSELDRWTERASSRPVAAIDPEVLVVLRVGLYQILRLDRIPRAAAVNEAVRQIRAWRGRAAASFVNAVLRQVCRTLDGSASMAPVLADPATSPAEHLAEKHSYSVALVRRWLGRLGFTECEALLEAMNRPAPVVLRATRRSGGAAVLAARLEREGVRTAPSPLLPEALRVLEGVPVRSRVFLDGWFYVQDEASQMVALLLGAAGPRWSLLDLCAAPGGKILGALDVAEAVPDPCVAADASLDRLKLLAQNAQRLRLGGLSIVCMDATRPALRSRFGRVLVDAPCSGTGVIRRHPEIRWRRTATDIATFAEKQAAMLRAASSCLLPGGRLVYAACSLEPEEGPDRIRALLGEHPDLRRVDARRILPPGAAGMIEPDGSLVTLPHRNDVDGFYAAVLEKHG